MDGLCSVGHVRGVDVAAAGGAVVVADLAGDADVTAKLMEGADAVVHLAAIASETDFVTAVMSPSTAMGGDSARATKRTSS
jgi:nucleoside-diphosphate-sugar epimerase